jgi:hypothetical protein
LRLLAGLPSWLVVLLERMVRARHTGKRAVPDLGSAGPISGVLIHGGVAFAPYASVLDEWIGRRLERIEVYPASEGFVGVQTEASGGLTLMLDYGIFYEFIPVEDLGSAKPRRHTVADVELGRGYAVVVSTPAGHLVLPARRYGTLHEAGSLAASHQRAHPPLRQRLR